MTNDERTTGMGLWTDAKNMLAAAKLVSAEEHLVTPAYYLAGHGIEEVFKAYLRSHGHSIGKLKKIGHNLIIARNEAIRCGFEDSYTLNGQEKTVIGQLNGYYKDKHFEYRVTGYMSLPLLPDLIALGERMLYSIKSVCMASIGI